MATIWSMLAFSSTIACRSIWPTGRIRHFAYRAGIVGAVELLQLLVQIGEAWLEAQPEPVQDGEVGLVDAVHVAGDRGRHDVRRVAIPDIEHVMRLVLVRADEPALQRHVVAQQRVGDDALAAAEVLARVARLHGRPLHAELLAVDGAVEHVEVERVVREDRQARRWRC